MNIQIEEADAAVAVQGLKCIEDCDIDQLADIDIQLKKAGVGQLLEQRERVTKELAAIRTAMRVLTPPIKPKPTPAPTPQDKHGQEQAAKLRFDIPLPPVSIPAASKEVAKVDIVDITASKVVPPTAQETFIKRLETIRGGFSRDRFLLAFKETHAAAVAFLDQLRAAGALSQYSYGRNVMLKKTGKYNDVVVALSRPETPKPAGSVRDLTGPVRLIQCAPPKPAPEILPTTGKTVKPEPAIPPPKPGPTKIDILARIIDDKVRQAEMKMKDDPLRAILLDQADAARAELAKLEEAL